MKDRLSRVPSNIHQRSPVIAREPEGVDVLYYQSLETFKKNLHIHIQDCELSSQVMLTENEKAWLTRFAETAFLLEHTIGDDKHDNELASWACLYAINEAFEAKNLNTSIEVPSSEPLKAANGPYPHQVISNIDYAREVLMDSERDFSEITRLDSYLPNVIPLYIVARYLTYKQRYPKIEGDLSHSAFMQEFGRVAEAMMISENPDVFFDTDSIKARAYWSKMSVLTMDYWLRERMFPAFVFGNWALNEVTNSSDYPTRWQKSASLKLSDFSTTISEERVIDFTVVPKGVMGVLQRALNEEVAFKQVKKVSGSPETDSRYRVQMLAEIVDRYLGSNENDTDEEILLQVLQKIANLHDLYRARVIIPNESLKEVVSGLVGEGKEVLIYLERNVKGNSEKRIVNITSQNCEVVDPEDIVRKWQEESRTRGAISTYAVAKIVSQIDGVNSELQIMRLSDTYDNWASRRVYKSLPKNTN